jgi:predicted ferric reductase
MTLPRWILPAAWMAAGALALSGATDLLDALSQGGLPWMWWSIRALGLVALLSLWLGMMFGVLLAGKGGLIEPRVGLALHQHQVLASALATVLHVLLAVADGASDLPAIAAVLPFTSPELTGPLALGTVALWAIVALVASSALRSRLSRDAWRAVHGTAYGGFALALAHGWTAGTDTATPGVRGLYVVLGATLLAATLQRALLAWHGARTAEPPAAG